MAGKIDVKKAAITLGVVFAAWHLGWVLAILVLGSEFVDWVMGMHFISMPIPLGKLTIDIVTLAIGVVTGFVCGAITGAIFAYVWNKL